MKKVGIPLQTNHLSEKPIMKIRNIKKHYEIQRSFLERVMRPGQTSKVYAVNGVDLDVFPGETLGLVGESGCGKSTLGRVILKLHEETSGEIYFEDKNITNLRGTELKQYRNKVQIIFQNPYASLNPRKTIYEILKVAVQASGITKEEEQHVQILRLLDHVGLSERHLEQYPHQFSGGQQQRIGIARALAMKPSFIVADEPVSALDVSIQAQILNLMEELKKQLNLTYLFIAHDLSVVYHVSDRVAVMYLGQIVELAETDKLFDNPKHPYTQALLSSIPSTEPINDRERIILSGTVPTPTQKQQGCVFKNRCFMKIGKICDEVRPELTDVNGHFVACHHFEKEDNDE